MEVSEMVVKPYPAVRFIGKKYTNHDRDERGTFAEKWQEWFDKGWFEPFQEIGIEPCFIGLMSCGETIDGFRYWVGVLTPENTKVPEGYDYIDIPACDMAQIDVYGDDKTGEIYGEEPLRQCLERVKQTRTVKNFYRGNDFGVQHIHLERYVDGKCCIPDDKGNVILEYGIYVK